MHNRSAGGFSILDGMIAALIVSIAIVGMMGALRNIQRNNTESIINMRATELANNALEAASATLFESLNNFTWEEQEYPNLSVAVTVIYVDITGAGDDKNILNAPPGIETEFKKITAEVTVPGEGTAISLSAVISNWPYRPRPNPLPLRADGDPPLEYSFQDNQHYPGSAAVDKWYWDLDGSGVDPDVIVTLTDETDPLTGEILFRIEYPSYIPPKQSDLVSGIDGLPPPFSYTYAYPGHFTATLKVRYESDGGTFSKKRLIEVTVGEPEEEEDDGEETPADPDPPPTALFAMNPEVGGVAPLTVTFTDLSTFDPTTTITAWAWTFGDGGSSPSQNPEYDYITSGTYTVSLTVTDGNNQISVSTNDINVTAPFTPPTADFSINPEAGGVAPLTVTFTDLSTYDLTTTITGWAWTFGDGESSPGQNPVHEYTTDGQYTVRLTVTDDNSLDHYVEKSVTVSPPPPPTIQFSYSAGNGDDCTTTVDVQLTLDKPFTSITDVPITVTSPTSLIYGSDYEIEGFNQNNVSVTFSTTTSSGTIRLLLVDTDNFGDLEQITLKIDPSDNDEEYARGAHPDHTYSIANQAIPCHQAEELPGDLGVVGTPTAGGGIAPYQGNDYNCNNVLSHTGDQGETFLFFPFRIKKEHIIDQFTGSYSYGGITDRERCEMEETAQCLYAYGNPYGNQSQSNLQKFDIIQTDASVFFLHIDPETDKVTLGMIHDTPAIGDGGGYSEFKFKGFKKNNNSDIEIALTASDVIVKDDPGGKDNTSDEEGNIIRLYRRWNDKRTDGAMISLGTTWGEFCIETWPGPVQGKPFREGEIYDWVFRNASGINHEGEFVPDSSIALDMGSYIAPGEDRPEKKLTIYFKPRLVTNTPVNGSEIEALLPIIFSWANFSDLATYTVKLCEDENLTTGCTTFNPDPDTNTSVILEDPLELGDWYWSVKATNLEETSYFIWSETSSFRIQ